MKALVRALSTLAALLPAACGWHAGLGRPANASTVGVEAARRSGTTLERGLEPLLTDALSIAVADWVELPLVSPQDADLVVRAVLLDYARRGGVRNQDNELLESAVFVRASAELFDRRSGKSLGAPVIAQEWSGYALERGNSEAAARDRAIRHVANTLILDLFEDKGQ